MNTSDFSNSYFMTKLIKINSESDTDSESLNGSSDFSETTNSSNYDNSSEFSDSDNLQENNLDLRNDIINKYNIITELGRGAYSIVWLGYSIEDEKYYAIKVQNPDDYSEGKDEIKILKKISKSQKYINKLVHYFIEERFVDDKITKFVCSVYELCCGNLDSLARKGYYKNGFPINIVKKIFRQICTSIDYLHNELKIFHGDIKTDNILLCGINNRDKKYIKLYNDIKFKEKYSIIKKKYWVEKGKDLKNIKKMDKLDKLKIRKTLHTSILENLEKNEESCYLFNETYLDYDNIKIKLTDFGHYCPDDEKFEEEFGTRYYQAPEIILMGDCKKTVDIWALGCTLYELLTGEILFDPNGDRYNSTDYYHLDMMINLCGKFEKNFLMDTKYYRNFFDKKFNLKDKKKYKKHSPIEILKEKLTGKIDSKYIDDVVDLLSKMLKLTPYKRIKIKDILNHRFIQEN